MESQTEFGIPRSTLSTTVKSEVNISVPNGEGILGSKFHMTKAELLDIEKCLPAWFNEPNDKNVRLSNVMLPTKAKELALSLGHDNSQASSP